MAAEYARNALLQKVVDNKENEGLLSPLRKLFFYAIVFFLSLFEALWRSTSYFLTVCVKAYIINCMSLASEFYLKLFA